MSTIDQQIKIDLMLKILNDKNCPYPANLELKLINSSDPDNWVKAVTPINELSLDAITAKAVEITKGAVERFYNDHICQSEK